MLWRALGHVPRGCYLDVGAHDPLVDSVSLAFYERGWRGIHVEPSPQCAQRLREARPDETVIEAAASNARGEIKFFEIPGTGLSTVDGELAGRHQARGLEPRELSVAAITLDDAFARVPGGVVHWMKIDVEGHEKQVLEGWRQSTLRPWIVLIESTVPMSSSVSHQHWEDVVLAKGYRFAYFDGLNRYYVSGEHAELMAAFAIGPNVFDEFALNGTASASFCQVVNGRVNALDERLQAAEAGRQQLAVENERRFSEYERRLSEYERSQASLQQTVDAARRGLAELGASASPPESAARSRTLEPARLLTLWDAEFVTQAYRTLLLREPDPYGLENYVAELARGRSRQEIIRAMRNSAEGRRAAVDVRSIGGALLQARLYGAPLIGRALHRAVQVLGWVAGRGELRERAAHLSGQLQQAQAKLARVRNRVALIQSELSAGGKPLQGSHATQAGVPETPVFPLARGERTIYYFVDHTILCPVNTGMQRLTRQLARALLALGERVRFVKWHDELQQLVFVHRGDFEHLEKWHGPSLPAAELQRLPPPDAAPLPVEAHNPAECHWLLVPEVPHITFHERPVTLDVIMAAKRGGLKTAFVYFDAIPLRLQEYRDTADRHERYMQHLLLADLVLPISHRSAGELGDFFRSYQLANTTRPPIRALPLSGESHLSARAAGPADAPSEARAILCVGSIEPRKNQLKLIDAFEVFSTSPQGKGWELVLAGNLRHDVAARVHAAAARNRHIRYVQNPTDEELDALYRGATFTVFASVEEGFGLPILESLWYAKPCICANFGAMAEIAAGGGCLAVDVRSEQALHEAISRLSADAQLLRELAAQAATRKITTWREYGRDVSALLDSVVNPLDRVGLVYFWVDDTATRQSNSGIQRVTRQLSRAMLSAGARLIAVKWDHDKQAFYPPAASELAHLARWNGPPADAWHPWSAPSAAQPSSWLLLPELTHGTLERVLPFAKSMGMRCAAIFYDAIPWKLRDAFPPAFVEGHRQYMEAIGRFDRVFAISRWSCDDLTSFLLGDRSRTPGADHRFRPLALPMEFPDTDRCTVAKTRDASAARILAVISIEPRKNPLLLLEAFARAGKLTARPMTLTLVGRQIDFFAGLAEQVTQTLRGLPHAVWEREVDDSRLRQLYEEADFSILPSLEEGFGLPIAESLWHGRPCIAHAGGSMAEAARDGGCLLVDMRDADALAKAIAGLADDPELHARLSRQAIARKLKTWGDYARELIVLLATDRVADPVPAPADLPDGDGIFKELPNLAPRPMLSICISTYNRAGWLAVNLASMLRQVPESAREVEILICDNASTDDTEGVVAPYLGRRNFRYVRNPRNVGMLGNLRVTANEARGEYVWILGDDDLIRANAVRRVIGVIAAHRDLSLIYLNYAYTHATDPEKIGEIDAFINACPPIVDPGKDVSAPVRDIATNNENLFTAIYCLIFRRDHAIKAYAQNTDGRPFSTMRTSIPTTYYVLNRMMHEPACWIGEPLLVVNFNVSWNQYAPLQILERVPEALDLAERMGASAAGTDRWRANLVPGFPHYFREMFENDPLGNSVFFSPRVLVLRMKHLDAFARIVPELIEIYDRAHRSGHPAAKLPTAVLFSAF